MNEAHSIWALLPLRERVSAQSTDVGFLGASRLTPLPRLPTPVDPSSGRSAPTFSRKGRRNDRFGLAVGIS
jgi:hypothetical protein